MTSGYASATSFKAPCSKVQKYRDDNADPCRTPDEHRYHMRVHNPDSSLQLTRNFDKEVDNVLRSWLDTELSEEKLEWLRLPPKKGGIGLTPSEPIREVQFSKSKQAALERSKHLSASTSILTLTSGSQGSQRTSIDESVSEELHHNLDKHSRRHFSCEIL